jgi:hypothetical protein
MTAYYILKMVSGFYDMRYTKDDTGFFVIFLPWIV